MVPLPDVFPILNQQNGDRIATHRGIEERTISQNAHGCGGTAERNHGTAGDTAGEPEAQAETQQSKHGHRYQHLQDAGDQSRGAQPENSLPREFQTKTEQQQSDTQLRQTLDLRLGPDNCKTAGPAHDKACQQKTNQRALSQHGHLQNTPAAAEQSAATGPRYPWATG
jgi:hypothetical protein